MSGFVLDPRLAADSHLLHEGALAQWRLIDDARYDWLVLVPRVAGAVEWSDLGAEAASALLGEVLAAGELLRAAGPVDKLNVGALGNIVRQLHVHVLARREGDPAWPGPAWGHSPLQRREPGAREARLLALRARLAAPAG